MNAINPSITVMWDIHTTDLWEPGIKCKPPVSGVWSSNAIWTYWNLTHIAKGLVECTSKLLRGSISYSDVFHWFSSCPVTIVLVPERERDRERETERETETERGREK